MAGSSLIALIDDIAALLDDIAVMTKVAARQGTAAVDDVAAMTQMAAKKTVGVLGDDLALSAQQVTGVQADRELPVVWAVAKGSLVNKAILVPAALAISAFIPWAVTPLLMAGGAFLCFEGFEKLAHRFLRRPAEDAAGHEAHVRALSNPALDIVAFEKDRVKGAIRTDFILSAEIIAITLGTVATAPFFQQITVLSGVAVIMTAGVYGIVAGIVKLDDAGLWLSRRPGSATRAMGNGILRLAPWLMRALSVAGTAAMFMVGGGILAHGLPPVAHAIDTVVHEVSRWPGGGGVAAVGPLLGGTLVGVVAGAAMLLAVTLLQRVRAVFQD